MTFQAATDLFIMDARSRRLSPQTIKYYSGQLKAAAHLFGRKSIGSVTATELRTLLADAPAGSVYHRYRVLRRLFTFLATEEIIKSNPTAKLRPPKVVERVIHGLTKVEIDRCFKAASALRGYFAIRDAALFATLVSTGLRANELCTLREDDVDLESGLMKVMGKGSRERIVPIPLKLRPLLVRYKLHREDSRKTKHRECVYFFRSRSGLPMTTSLLGQMLGRIGNRAGIHLHPHMLRHTFATHFMGHDGADILSLQAICGWKQISMAQRYAKAQLPKLQRSMESFSPMNDL